MLRRLNAYLGVGLVVVLAGCASSATPGNNNNSAQDSGTFTFPDLGTDTGTTTVDLGTSCSVAAEDNLAACTDGCDNDANGSSDCNDTGCCAVSGISCGPDTVCGSMTASDAGMTTDDASVTDSGTMSTDGGAPACSTMGPENTLAACTDGCDNDGDHYADCGDSNCCAVSGVSCGPTTYCGRHADGGTSDASVPMCMTMGPENTIAACTDGCDNDGNHYVDCNDRTCCSVSGISCPSTSYCGRHAVDGGATIVDAGAATDAGTTDAGAMDASTGTDSGPMCAAGSMENTLAACTDSCDNDGDHYIDCGDRDCCGVHGLSCPSTSYCGRHPVDGGVTVFDAGTLDSGVDSGVLACMVHGAENTFAACTDGCDNDGDHYVDCGDSNCCGVMGISCGASTYCGRHPFDGGMSSADAGPTDMGATDAGMSVSDAGVDSGMAVTDAGMACAASYYDSYARLPSSVLPRCASGTFTTISSCTDVTCVDNALNADTTTGLMVGSTTFDCSACVNYQYSYCLQGSGCGMQLGDYSCCFDANCASDPDPNSCMQNNCATQTDALTTCVGTPAAQDCFSFNNADPGTLCFP